MRLKINGPAGAKWVGQPVRVVGLNNTPLRAISEVEKQVGMSAGRINAHVLEVGDDSAFATAISAMLALHNAGFQASWEEICSLTNEDFEVVEEPPVEDVDPTGAQADSRLGDAPAPKPRATRKRSA